MRFNLFIRQFAALLIFLIVTIGQLNAQDLVYQRKAMPFSYSQRDFILELSPNYVYREDAFPRITGNINMQYFITRNVSVNGNLSIGQDYLHFGPGILGISLLSMGGFRTWFVGDEFPMLILIMVGSLENISFHFPVSSNLDISPYFSLMRLQYLYDPPASEFNDFSLSLVLGSRLNCFFSDHWMISPYFEYTRTYVSGLDGFQGGIYIGYYFRTRISMETE